MQTHVSAPRPDGPRISNKFWHNLIKVEDPGCAVDIPGFCYTLSFASKHVFSRVYPPQEEILEYLTSVAKRFNVQRHFTGLVEWRGCQWNDATQKWIVEVEDIVSGQRYTQTCQVLVSCVGGLTNPRHVMFPGMSNFRGVVMHTAEWDHTINFSGKRVAVIGNGGRDPCLLATDLGADIALVQLRQLSWFRPWPAPHP